MGDLSQEVSRLVKNSMAENTWKAYKIGTSKLQQFRQEYQLANTYPVPVEQLLNFIAFLSIKNISASSIALYLSGISHLHKSGNMVDTTKFFMVCKALEGLRRVNPTNKDPRSPITFEILIKLIRALPSICFSKFENHLFQAAFSLAFFGLLRVGEFTSANRVGPNKAILQLEHAQISKSKPKSINLTISRSKTDQKGQSVILNIPSQKSGDTCPVHLLETYLSKRPNCGNLDLFIHENGQPLTRYQFNAVLLKALKFADINTGHFRSHSFRIGMATEMASRGVPPESIQKGGRWKSQAYTRYIRIDSF